MAPKFMHTDSFIDYLLKSLEESNQSQNSKILTYSQVLWTEILTQIVQNCGQAFRSKFVITLQGVVRLLTLVDG